MRVPDRGVGGWRACCAGVARRRRGAGSALGLDAARRAPTALLGYPVDRPRTRGGLRRARDAHADRRQDAIDVEVPGYRDRHRARGRPDRGGRADPGLRPGRLHGAALGRTPAGSRTPTRSRAARRTRCLRVGLREIRPPPFARPRTSRCSTIDDADRGREPAPGRGGVPADAPDARPAPRGRAQPSARGRSDRDLRGRHRRSGWPTRSRNTQGRVRARRPGGRRLGGRATVRSTSWTRKGTLEAVLGELGVRDWSLGDPLGPPFHPGPLGERADRGHRRRRARRDPPARGGPARDRRTGRRCGRRTGLAAAWDAAGPLVTGDVPRFPPVRRDLAFIVDEDVPAGAVAAAIQDAGGDLLAERSCSTSSGATRCPAGQQEPRVRARVPRRRIGPSTDDEAAGGGRRDRRTAPVRRRRRAARRLTDAVRPREGRTTTLPRRGT